MNKKNILPIVVFLILSVGFFFLLKTIFSPKSTPSTPAVLNEKKQEVTTTTTCQYFRVLDGVCVTSTEAMYSELTAVMIENHSEARPQSGLVDASVVYEVPVEANYTRFLTIFPKDTDVKKVGPVRSARPYYLDWISEYGEPMYMHVGGSPDALLQIEKNNIFDMNEFFHGWYYWRSTDRFAPHNAYTSSDLWKSAWDQTKTKKQIDGYQGWQFENTTTTCTADCISDISVKYLPPVYAAEWKYNSSTDQYARYQMGEPHVDQDGRAIFADTVIIQKVKTQVLDDKLRIAMNDIGSGEVIIFSHGFVKSGTWEKKTRTGKTIWKDENGNEIKIKPGKIWIQVVNQTSSVETK